MGNENRSEIADEILNCRYIVKRNVPKNGHKKKRVNSLKRIECEIYKVKYCEALFEWKRTVLRFLLPKVTAFLSLSGYNASKINRERKTGFSYKIDINVLMIAT